MAGPRNYDPSVQSQRVATAMPVYNAILSGDRDMAMDLYNISTKGSSRPGTGPFSRFFERFMAPIVLAAMNAESGGVDMTDPNNPKPRTMDFDFGQLMSDLQGGVTGGGLFDLIGGIGERAMGDFLGSGAAEDYDQLKAMAESLAPLFSSGLNRVYQGDFYRQQRNAFSDMFDRAVADPKFGDEITNWDEFFTDSPFFQQYYGGTKPNAAAAATGSAARRPLTYGDRQAADPYYGGSGADRGRLR